MPVMTTAQKPVFCCRLNFLSVQGNLGRGERIDDRFFITNDRVMIEGLMPEMFLPSIGRLEYFSFQKAPVVAYARLDKLPPGSEQSRLLEHLLLLDGFENAFWLHGDSNVGHELAFLYDKNRGGIWSNIYEGLRSKANGSRKDATGCGSTLPVHRAQTRGWLVNDKRIERIWRREGLKVPDKQPKRGRLWLADGSCIRLRPEHRNHVWSYDFVEDRTDDGRKYRMLNVIDEFTHECLAIRVARKLKAIDVIDVLSDLFILRGVPGQIRSDNGPEFVAKALQEWITAVGAKTAYIEPGSPWEYGYVESFNARLRDELLDGEIFYTLREAQIIIESWRRHFNTIRPHESLGYKPPAPEVFVPAFAAWPAALRRPAPPATLPLAQRPTLN